MGSVVVQLVYEEGKPEGCDCVTNSKSFFPYIMYALSNHVLILICKWCSYWAVLC